MSLVKRESDADHIAWVEAQDNNLWRGKRVLDIGCGSGFLCKYALDKGASFAMGIDILIPPGLGSMEKWLFEKIDLEEANWHDRVKKAAQGSCDLIFAFDILEHVKAPWHLLHAVLNLLDKKGRIIITTPNVNSWERYVKPQNWSGVIDPQHKTLFNSYSLHFMLQKIGFEIEYLAAPIRKLGNLNQMLPPLGGQLFCIGKKP